MNFVGETEQQIFRQSMCAGIVLLGKQILMKLTLAILKDEIIL
jgi:hypothetical protein